MPRFRHLVSALLLALPMAVAASQPADRTVVFVLFDGFAPAMIEAADTPNLDRARREGSWTHDMRAVFPTISAVNHNSYVTGCLPGDHGIVSNYFIDPSRGYYDGSRDADWRTGCDTLWETVEMAGGTGAVLGFAGNFSSTRGPTATHAPREESWKDSAGDTARTDQVIELLNLTGDERPQVIAAYYSGPDWTGHWQGTTAPDTLAATSASDQEVGRLMAAIETLPDDREVVLFIAADHSMVDVGPYFNIGRVFSKHDIKGRFASDSAHAFVYLDDPADTQQVADTLRGYGQLDAVKHC